MCADIQNYKTIILHHIYNSRQQLYTAVIYIRGHTHHVDGSLYYIKYIDL